LTVAITSSPFSAYLLIFNPNAVSIYAAITLEQKAFIPLILYDLAIRTSKKTRPKFAF